MMPHSAHHIMLHFQWLLAVDISRAYITHKQQVSLRRWYNKIHHKAKQCFQKSPCGKSCERGNLTLFVSSCGDLVRYFISY